jgi:hypothetical protein
MEKAIDRAINSDMVNGEYVIENTDYDKCLYIKNPDRNNE